MLKLNAQETGSVLGCFALIIVNLSLGGWCFGYSLESVFGKDIPWYGDMVAGLFLGQFTIPSAVVCWILKLCGVETPFID